MNIRSALVLLCLSLGVATQAHADRRDGVWVFQAESPRYYNPGYRHENRPYQYDPRSPYPQYPHYQRNLPPRYQGQLPPQYYDRQRGFERRQYWRQEHRYQRSPLIRDGRDHRLRPDYGRGGRYQYYRR
ncbi:hypothetical protein [Pseudomonas lopnurensis]|uniref:hypothetical protein n=1 Tax=Pseudomonas lopnurensis TaxID=1477517 RepID=UPI00187A8CBB|nr:hypothetical protein [Pseudomonas lopnurensis]MBE7375882.1 hypothetical protein [Pseudomonas lopnurensis]